jgi:predicted phage terminase large subunit-like protein
MNNSKEAVKQYLRQEIARRDFWRFCLYMDREFFESREFLKEIADAFQQVEEKIIKSLSVSMPPRAGKSYITSLFCAWTLGRNPDKSVMRNTCTATLYIKFSYDVRAILKHDRYGQVFPNVRLSDDKANLQGWNTNHSKMVGYFGAGVGGTIIGFGASNVAITDDLYRGMEDALSDTQNDRILQWKEATHDSRFETGCARIDIGTRWSIRDVIGKQMDDGIYDKSIVVPALTEEGETFCESVMTTDEYLEKKKRTENSIWLAEYMQQPIDVEGRLFRDLKYVTKEEFALISKTTDVAGNEVSRIEGAVAYIDVSDMGKDFTSMAVAVVIGKQLYIVDYLFNRDNTDITIPMCAEKLKKWNVSYVRVESNSMGAMFARQLQTITETKVLQVYNSTNKITRIIMNAGYIMNNMNFVKNDNADSEQFMQNVVSFSKEGKNKHDDAPDCLAGLSIFVQSMFRNLV